MLAVMPSIYKGVMDPNSGPHTCISSTISTELLPQLLYFAFQLCLLDSKTSWIIKISHCGGEEAYEQSSLIEYLS